MITQEKAFLLGLAGLAAITLPGCTRFPDPPPANAPEVTRSVTLYTLKKIQSDLENYSYSFTVREDPSQHFFVKGRRVGGASGEAELGRGLDSLFQQKCGSDLYVTVTFKDDGSHRHLVQNIKGWGQQVNFAPVVKAEADSGK